MSDPPTPPTSPNPSTALARAVVDELARCGVTDAVLSPGSRSTALALALHDDERIALHVVVDERSAGFVALGIARGTGRPAVVVTTSGSAVANLHPAVVEADTARVPLLLVTADRPPELRATGANQTIVQAGMFPHALRWWVDLPAPEDRADTEVTWRATTCRGFAEAIGAAAAPGPVQLNLGFREPTVPLVDDGRSAPVPWTHPAGGRPDGTPWTAVEIAPRVPSEATLDRLASRVLGAHRGLVVVGQTTAPAEPVHALAAVLDWPIVAEPCGVMRSGSRVVTDPHALFTHPGFLAARPPDLVLRIGRPGLSRAVPGGLDAGTPQVLVDPHGAFDDPDRTVAELVVADVGATCTALVERVRGRRVATEPDWSPRWFAADLSVRAAVDAVLDANDTPSEPRTARDLAAGLPVPCRLVVASSMPVRDLGRVLAPREGLAVHANRGASGIDGFVSTTLGIAIASTAPTIGITGDLALLHDANGFLLSPQGGRPDVVFVVLDNDGGGIFHLLPQARVGPAFERVFGTPHGRDPADLARLHRLGYERVDSAARLADAVNRALGTGGVGIVHVRTSREANAALHRELDSAARSALDEHV